MKRWLLVLMMVVVGCLWQTGDAIAFQTFRKFSIAQSAKDPSPQGVKRWLLVVCKRGSIARSYRSQITDYWHASSMFLQINPPVPYEWYSLRFSIGDSKLEINGDLAVYWKVVADGDPCLREWKEAALIVVEGGPT